MNKTKISNPLRLIAFFLTSIILVCTFGFTADGWLSLPDEDKPSGDASQDNGQDDLPDDEGENEDPPSSPEEPDEPEIIIPEYTNRITGLETDVTMANRAHLAFVMNPSLPCYGISSADMIVELPTEEGTRLIAFIPSAEELWKIGSITSTRGYISNIVKYFGSVCVSAGNDDTKYYTRCDMKGHELDLSKDERYHYTEFTSNVYTNRDLLESGLVGTGVQLQSISAPTLPYAFPEFGAEKISFGENYASKITLSNTAVDKTELIYNAETESYALYKNGVAFTDAINNCGTEFQNCFVLFADSVTYDTSECSRMIMDTIGTGTGIYFTGGSFCSIAWVGTGDGKLVFYDTDGNILTANRGKSYLSFMKSSVADEGVIYE